MQRMNRITAVGRATLLMAATAALAAAQGGAGVPPAGGQVIELSLERMVQLAMDNSYQIRRLNLEVERTSHRLRAELAGLKSRVDLEMSIPAYELISESRWNSSLQRYEITRENSRRWEAELSVSQPVVLFGYPTNGRLSLNNRVYRYTQLEEEGNTTLQYYNRYYIAYEQPLFQPNGLKNDLEEARLDLERAQLDFQDDVVELIDDVAGEYFELFESAYQARIREANLARLEKAMAAATTVIGSDSTRAIEADQIRVETANARERLQQVRSSFRLRAASAKQQLRLAPTDSLVLNPVAEVTPVLIDVDEAIRFGMELTPRFRQLDIRLREDEIRLANTKGRNSFRMDLELSYGREMQVQDRAFSNLWESPSNSYTLGVNAFLPIWDWGERRAEIAAAEVGIRSARLSIEEARSEIVSNVRNEVRNVEEYQNRVLTMQENLNLAGNVSETSLNAYRAGSISAVDLLRSFQRESETAENLLEAYLGWREALLSLQELTFFDYERRVPIVERFGIRGGTPLGG